MTPVFWLASYPKSGNTWFRMLLANLIAEAPVDINAIHVAATMATGRRRFDDATMIESILLTDDEIRTLRPAFHRFINEESVAAIDDGKSGTGLTSHLIKSHDAYAYATNGEPVLGGTSAAAGAVLLVRDPRDVAISLANHMNWSLDRSIDYMASRKARLAARPSVRNAQLPHSVFDWSGFVASWLDQTDLSVHLVRFEDLWRDTAAIFGRALAFLGQHATNEGIERAICWSSIERMQRLEEEKGFREAPPWPGQRFFRRGVAEGWRDELTLHQVARVEHAHADMMHRLGYRCVAIGDASIEVEKMSDSPQQ